MFSGVAQAAASAQATSMTQRPSGMIRPVYSANGMNSAGETGPRLAWSQRNSASKATGSRVAPPQIG